MANVSISLPDGQLVEVDEAQMADPKVRQQLQDLHDRASGDISPGEYVGAKARAFGGGVLQNLAEIPKFVAVEAKRMDKAVFGGAAYGDKPASELKSFKAGKWLEGLIDKPDARVREDTSTKITTGLGQFFGQAASALITKNPALSAVSTVSMQGAGDYEKAKQKGASEADATTAGAWGGVWGLTDLAPLESGLAILKGTMPGLKKLSLEGYKKLLAVGGVQGTVEGSQELFQEWLSNETAKLTYNEKQDLTEGLKESFTVGGAVGAIAGMLLHAVGVKGKVNFNKPKDQPADTNPLSAAEAVEAMRARGVGATAQESVTSAPAESVELEPTTVDTIQANEDGMLTPSQTFAKQMMDAGKSDSEVHTSLTLLNVIAQTRGMDLDTFVEKSIAGVQSGTAPAEGDTLNQQEVKQEDLFKDSVGEPVVGFHGTQAEEFTSFDDTKQQQYEHGWAGAGHYFTPNSDYAKSYSDIGEGTGRIVEAEFTFKNPIYTNTPEYKKTLKDTIGKSGIHTKEESVKVTDALKAAGYDAVIVGDLKSPSSEINAFYSKDIHIKNKALNQTGQATAPFFSKLESVVNEKMPNRMRGEELYRMLEGKVPKEELNLLDFGHEYNVETSEWEDKVLSKKSVLEQIKAASVQTEDVVLGEPPDSNIVFNRIQELMAKGTEREIAIEQAAAESNTQESQFSSYQLPGSKEGSYREMFVTAPSLESSEERTPSKNLEFANTELAGQELRNNPTLMEQFNNGQVELFERGGRTFIGDINESDPYHGKGWQDGHSQYSSVQNPIVRIRYNEREVDGKRILFVEEMQGPSDSEQSKMPGYLRKRIYDIGTKRVLALAKEQGFDGVAWTTGEQQAERYDLSKQIKQIDYNFNNLDPGKNVRLSVSDVNGDEVIDSLEYSWEDLPGTIGKEISQKIHNKEGREDTDGWRVLEGLDLKVGGEGLKDTYNKRIPSLMKKYGKGSVEGLSFNTDNSLAFDPATSTNPIEDYERAKDSETTVQYTPITSSTPNTYSLFQSLRPKNGQSGSNVQGSVNFLEDGRAVITLMTGSDQSTMLHEIGHILRRWLSPEEMVTANEFVGATNDKWSVEQEEMWARGWERYLRRGKAPSVALKTVFEKLRTWLRRIYKTVKGSEIDVRLDQKTIALFDKILTPAELPSQRPAWAMPFDAWVKVFGEDEAALYGLTKKSVSIRKTSRFNTLVNAISGKGARGVMFGRYMTPADTEAQLQLVSDPTYLQQPLANRNIDEYIVRVLNLFATRANSNFHLGESVEPLLAELKEQRESADRKGLFDDDPGHGYADDNFSGYVTRRMSFDDTIGFIEKLGEVQAVRQSWATPAREQMLNIKNTIYHGTQDVVMDRTTGRIYAIEHKGIHSASMIDVDRGDIRRVTSSDLNTKFIWPELIADDGKATLTREEWMAEKHYEMVVDALEKGESVPSYVIATHLTKDPMLQEAFDKAKKQEDSLDGTDAQSQAITELFQETQGETLEDTIVPPVRVGAASSATLEDLEQIGRMVTESLRELTRLGNVLDQTDGPRLTDLIKKTEIQKLARAIGGVGDASVEHYIAELFNELDEYKQALETQAKDFEPGGVAALTDRVVTLYRGLKSFTESVENNGQARLLDEVPEVNQIRRLNHWAQRTLLHKEPSMESSAGRLFEKVVFTMQGLSWRHPILKPLFKSWIHMNNSATKLAHDLFLGKPEIETLTFQNAKGTTEIKLKMPGLRTLKTLTTNSPAYDAMRSLILVGDKLHTQFTLDEVMLGMGERVDGIVTEAEKMSDGEEKQLAIQKAVAFQALDEVLARRSVEERKQAALAYFEIQDSLQYMYFKTKKVLTDMLGRAGDDVMKQIAPHGYIPGYFPHMRFGKYGVVVKGEGNVTKYFTAFEDWVSQKNALAELKAKYPNDTVVTVDTSNKLEYAMGGGQDLLTALQDVIGRTKLNEVIQDKDALETVQKMLLETTSEMVKAQGIFSMFKERTDIPGFDERISQVTHKRVTDFASAMAKIEFAQKGAQELAGVRSNAHLYNYAKEWFGAILEGADVNDANISKIRAAIFLKHLGFNVKTALVMFMDKLTNAPSVMGRYTTHADTKIIKGLGDSMKFMSWLHEVEKTMNAEGLSRDEAVKKAGLPEGFDAEIINALLWSKDSGATLAKFAPEVWAHEDMTWESGRSGQSGVGRAMDITKFGLSKVFDASSWMGSKMEEMNKLSTFLTAYKVFRNEKGWTYDRAIDVAQDVVNDAHVVYGRGNIPLPFLRKGIWKYTRTAYIFRAFEHNYLQLMINMSTIEGKKGKLMAVRSLATLAALAGAPALPFFTLLFKLYGMSTGDDPEQWFRRTLTKVTGSEWAARLFSDGLPAVAGVTLRGSLQVGAYESWEEIATGVAGSTVKDIAKATGQGWNGDWDGFSKTILPSSLGNLYKAQQGATTGVITGKGGVRREGVIGDVVKYQGFERLLKAASFTIEREAASQRLDTAMRREDTYWQGRRDSIYTKFAKGARMEDKAYIQAALDEAVAYERERASRKAFDVTPISRYGLKKSLEESGLKKKNVLQVLRMTGKLP